MHFKKKGRENENFKRLTNLILAILITFSLVILPVYATAGRKIINKTVSDSFVWSSYTFNYSFNAYAVLTYNNSNNITQISDLSFSNITCTSGVGGTATIIPKQKSKTYSGKTATYVITVTRTAFGSHTSKVDYTLTYKVSDSGAAYAPRTDEAELVNIQVSSPYDVIEIE